MTRRAHFCWCCGIVKANEQFSGSGHARHLCRECSKLGAAELAFRQTIRTIDRTLDRNTGRVKWKQRESFARFLRHPNERVRRYAESIVRAQRSSEAVDDEFAEAGGSYEAGSLRVTVDEWLDDDSWRDELPHEPAIALHDDGAA